MTTIFKFVITCELIRLIETLVSAYYEVIPDTYSVTDNVTYLLVNVSDQYGCIIQVFSFNEDDIDRQFLG